MVDKLNLLMASRKALTFATAISCFELSSLKYFDVFSALQDRKVAKSKPYRLGSDATLALFDRVIFVELIPRFNSISTIILVLFVLQVKY